MQVSPPPGWYPDPAAPDQGERWWDGQSWSPAVRPTTTPPAPPAPAGPYWSSVAPGRRERAAQPPAGPSPGSPSPLGAPATATIPVRALWWAALGFVVGEVLGGLLAAAVVGVAGGRLTGAGATLAGEIGLWAGLLGAVILVSRRYGTGSLSRDFTLGFRPMDLVYGLAAAVTGLAVAAVVEIPFAGTRFAGTNTSILNGQRGHSAGFALVTVIVAVGAPVVEELFFRGLIRTSLASRLGGHGAIWGQALLFGLAHVGGAHGWGNVSVVVAIASLGVILGYTAYFTRRLGAGMVAHSLFNLTAALTILLR